MRKFLILGFLFGLLGVANGAFGAHVLKQKLSPDMFEIFEVAVRYEMYHALALLAVAWMLHTWNVRETAIAGWLFTVGIFLFSGSLFALSLTGARWFGAIAPLGGLCFLSGWGLLVWISWKIIPKSS